MMRHAFVIVALLLIPAAVGPAAAAALPATAPVERFIADNTMLAVEADLSKVDAEALAWGSDVMIAILAKDAEALALAREDAARQQAQYARWMNEFRAPVGGACAIVAVTDSQWILDAGFAIYVEVPPAGDPERVELLFGGGPEARKRKQGQPRHRGDWVSDVKIWPGRVVGRGGGAHREPPKAGRPRVPAFAEALAAGPDGAGAPAVRVGIVPDQKLRDLFAQNLPAAGVFIEPMKWLSVRYDAAPLPLKTPPELTATYRARDAASAATVAAAWTALLDTIYTRGGLEPAEVQRIVHQLTPGVEGDRLVLSLAAEELPRLIADARPAIRKAWRLPPPGPPKSARGGGSVVGRGTGSPDERGRLGYH